MEALSGRHQISVLRWSITARMQFFVDGFCIGMYMFICGYCSWNTSYYWAANIVEENGVEKSEFIIQSQAEKTKSSTLFFNVKSQNKNEQKQKNPTKAKPNNAKHRLLEEGSDK